MRLSSGVSASPDRRPAGRAAPRAHSPHAGAQESPGDALVAAADAALALGREMQGAVVTAQVRRRPLMPDAVRAAAEAAGEQLAALTVEQFRGQQTVALGFLTVDVGAGIEQSYESPNEGFFCVLDRRRRCDSDGNAVPHASLSRALPAAAQAACPPRASASTTAAAPRLRGLSVRARRLRFVSAPLDVSPPLSSSHSNPPCLKSPLSVPLAGTARASLPRNVNIVAVRVVDGFFRADGAEGRRGASVTLVAGPVGAFDSASVPISSGEDADPGVCNAAAEAAAALRARNQGPLRGIIAGGPTGWEEAALNGIAKEVVCSLYSIRSVKGPPGAWLVPVDSHKGAGLGLLAMGVTAISARPTL